MSNLKTSQERKQLETRKTKLNAEIKSLHKELQTINQQLYEKKKYVKKINYDLKRLNTKPSITEHAILRFIERHYQLDLEEISKEILTESLKVKINSLGSGKYPISRGRTVVVKDKCIVSIV